MVSTTRTSAAARPGMWRAPTPEWSRSPRPMSSGAHFFFPIPSTSTDRRDNANDRVLKTANGRGPQNLNPPRYDAPAPAPATVPAPPFDQKSDPKPAKPPKTAKAAHARGFAQHDDNAPSFPRPLDTEDIRQTREFDRVSETWENPGSTFKHDDSFQGYRYLHSQSVESFLTSPVSSILPPLQSPLPGGTPSSSTTRSGSVVADDTAGETGMASTTPTPPDQPASGKFYQKLARKLSVDGAGQPPARPQKQQHLKDKDSKENWSISKLFNKSKKRPNKAQPQPTPASIHKPPSTALPILRSASFSTSPFSSSNHHHHHNHNSTSDQSPPQLPPIFPETSQTIERIPDPPLASPSEGFIVGQPHVVPMKSNGRTSSDVGVLLQLQQSNHSGWPSAEDDINGRERGADRLSSGERQSSQLPPKEKLFGVSTYISAGDDDTTGEQGPKRKINWRSTAEGLANNFKASASASVAATNGVSRSRSVLRSPKHHNDAQLDVRRASSSAVPPPQVPARAPERIASPTPIADQENARILQQQNGLSMTPTTDQLPADMSPRPPTAMNAQTMATLGCPPRKPVTSISPEEASSNGAGQAATANGEPKKRTLEQRIEDVKLTISDMERKALRTERNIMTLKGIDMRFDLVRQRKHELDEDLATLKADLHMRGLVLNRLVRKKDERDMGSPDGLWVRRIG